MSPSHAGVQGAQKTSKRKRQRRRGKQATLSSSTPLMPSPSPKKTPEKPAGRAQQAETRVTRSSLKVVTPSQPSSMVPSQADTPTTCRRSPTLAFLASSKTPCRQKDTSEDLSQGSSALCALLPLLQFNPLFLVRPHKLFLQEALHQRHSRLLALQRLLPNQV